MTNNRHFTKILLCAIFVVVTTFVHAHQIGISRGNYDVVSDVVKAELIFARPEMIAVLPQLDRNNDGTLTENEIVSSNAIIEKVIVNRAMILADSKACSAELKDLLLTEGDGFLIHASFRCPETASELNVKLDFLDSFSRGHRHLVTATSDNSRVEAVTFVGNSEFQLIAKAKSQKTSTLAVVGSLFHLGIEHILTGYDHLLFLFGLILIGGGIRQLMIVVTSFTLAHSVTLGLSAFGVWAPSPAFIEPAIALSIAYVGVENWFIKNASRRWLITFPFGLIHGFGFAGALGELSVPHGQIPIALGSFNLGVEAGQIAFLLVTMPIVLWLRKQNWFAVSGVRGLSTAIVIAGVWMLIQRIV